MVEKMDIDEGVTRDSVLKLMDKKAEIEKTLKELKEVLDGNAVGMNDELVDSEGFPRQDIDVYQVRHARHQIICLQNDHKTIMKKIEEGLHALHSESRESMDSSSAIVEERKRSRIPIAKVNLVETNSPAFSAGLEVDDLILEFGSVNYDNFKSLQDIGKLVQHSVGRNVPLTVKRGEMVFRLVLTPKEWSGKGFLGCNILPVENIDR